MKGLYDTKSDGGKTKETLYNIRTDYERNVKGIGKLRAATTAPAHIANAAFSILWL